MTTHAGDTGTAARGGAGALLRGWRELRRISQLELALRAGSSARHISFVETGRSRPSRELLLRLAGQLDVPVRERNALLVAAGYAPHFPERPLDDPALEPLRAELERLLAGYDPYPAFVVDGMYTVVAANRGLAALLEDVAAPLLEPPVNALRIALHPGGLAPRIRNLAEWRGHLLGRLERQLPLVRSAPLRALHEELRGYPAPSAPPPAPGPADASASPGSPATGSPGAGEREPVALPMRLEHSGRVLSFVSAIATFNTPMDVTVSELAIETLLPADRETGEYLRGTAP
ncbi:MULTISPECIES: helix-turn-helix domain-containing protein [Streptomyces]|uniref:Helix-turn-helix domain-containing protein n=2 Tax=Streptomyces TaxID=1883 RepID=A0A3R7IKT3_9ACTN|nr:MULTISPECIES: helix-turn-helix transcriptional regulator [Streptomyces]KNE82384.1 XRE family transcriptional regulator [Streptomyces fradiae]OFA52455.1 transcriptional regulator [Streptomyces fradiae]PQM21086.1 transcriptional regulator [Streptomyces xinghaiensis]RKM91061.1 helix-turn-helix domain-containing protein [Streptomyces xinghaiensis]RNC72527.1 helix-turn-helix domain-containing protein [Streptomyces xinghaiensis]